MRKYEKGKKDEVSVHRYYVELRKGGRVRGR
jgi:hypothetical protein